MSTSVQRRRGTTAQHSTFTGAVGELTVDTDKKTVIVHDGVTVGGTQLAKMSDVSAPATLTALTAVNGGYWSGLRDRIINGSIKIDQRNLGAAQTFTAAAALAYCVDRFYGYCSGANVTGQQVAGSLQSQKRYQFTGAASVTGIGFGQRIEQANSYDLNGRTATFSVDLANSLLTGVTWTAYYANTADTFGSLAAPTRTQIATGTFVVSAALARYYAQIAIPAAATTGIEIVLSVGAQISGTWTIGEVALVPGAVNETWKEQRPLAIELIQCQWYFRRITFGGSARLAIVYSAAGGTQSSAVSFSQMRAIPTASVITQPTGALFVRALDDAANAAYTTLAASGLSDSLYMVSVNASLANASQILAFGAVLGLAAEL